MQVQVVGGLAELVGDHGRHRVLRREDATATPRGVADHHRHGHGLAERAAEAEHDGADDADAPVLQRDANRLPPRRAEGVGALTLRAGTARSTSRATEEVIGHHHDREDEHRRQHAHAERRPREQRQLPQGVRERDLQRSHRGHQHEDAPEAVDDRRDRREQLGELRERRRRRGGQRSVRKMAMPSATGAASSSASTDEYSVPQMNGRAPKSPDTGSQVSVVQNARPNFSIASHDWRVSSTAMPATSTTTTPREHTVPSLNQRSE